MPVLERKNVLTKDGQISFCDKIYQMLVDEYYRNNPEYYVREGTADTFTVDIIKDCKFVEDVCNCSRSLSRDKGYDIKSMVTMPRSGQRIEIRKAQNKNGYTYVCIRKYANTYTVHIQTNAENICFLKSTYEEKVLLIYDDMSIYTSARGKYYPSSVYDLLFMPVEIQNIIFSLYGANTKIWRDFISDEFYPPLPLSKLSEYYNKKDYLEQQFRVKLPKSVNKRNFNQMYYLCCATSYIKPEQIMYLLSAGLEYNEPYTIRPTKRNKKVIAKKYITWFLQQRLQNERYHVLEDYVEMALAEKEPIDIRAGKKKIREYHDRMKEQRIERNYKNKKLEIPETPLKYLKLPQPFKLLKTKKALIDEGNRNYNCVGGYIDKINDGQCIIYTADIDGEHLTIEIRYRKNRGKGKKYSFYVNQCYKAYNRPCKEENLKFVIRNVENCSETAIDRFLKTKK